MYEYKASGMGSGNEAKGLHNNNVILDLTALLIATWLGWPDTPPSSKVTICRGKKCHIKHRNPRRASSIPAYTAGGCWWPIG